MRMFQVTAILLIVVLLVFEACASQTTPSSTQQSLTPTSEPIPPSNPPPQAEQEQTEDLANVLKWMASCKKILQETPTQPVDANNDGIIDSNDTLVLMGEYNDNFSNRIQPILDKAGIKTNEQGELPADSIDRLRDKLTTSELNELTEALEKGNELTAQICATIEKAAQNKK